MPINLLRQYKTVEEYNNDECSFNDENVISFIETNLTVKFAQKFINKNDVKAGDICVITNKGEKKLLMLIFYHVVIVTHQ